MQTKIPASADQPLPPVVSILTTHRDRLGECPLWDASLQCLYWVDAVAGRVQRLHPASGRIQYWDVPGAVGSIALARAGHLLLALADGFYTLDTTRGEAAVVALVAPVFHPAPGMRLNDGRTDRQGRFVCGSMVLGRHTPEGSLYRLNLDGSVEQIDTGIAISNAICFSPEGDRIYYADSLAHAVYCASYDGASGKVGPRTTFLDTRSLGAVPDGAVVDANGNLWLALVQKAALAQFSPQGALLRQVVLPTTFVSCPAFGGAELQTLFATSISNSGNSLVANDENAGYLFQVAGLGVRGLAETPYGGPLGTRSDETQGGVQ